MDQATIQLIVTLVINIVSVIATLGVLITYTVFKRHYPVALSRSTLVLSACIALADFFEHTFNLAGYTTTLPDSACGVVGGFFFAVPLLCSVFYACSVALNCLLVFVLRKRQTKVLQWIYLGGPPVASILIGVGALASGTYGFDNNLGYCWYADGNVSRKLLLARELLTFCAPLFFCFAFLAISVAFIIYALFTPSYYQSTSGGRSIPPSTNGQQLSMPSMPNNTFTSSVSTIPQLSTPSPKIISARAQARRALLFRLVAYIIIPLVTIFPMTIDDLYTESTGQTTSFGINLATAALGSLVGLFNAIVYFSDPTILAILGVIRRGEFNNKQRDPEQVSGISIRGPGLSFSGVTSGGSGKSEGGVEEDYEMSNKEERAQLGFGHNAGSTPMVIYVQVTQESDAVEMVAKNISDL